jgi:hypothetical protein
LKTWFRNHLARALCAALPLVCAGVQASPTAVEPLDAPAWKQLRSAPARPTVVVFTATYCAYCPAVIDQMAREIRQRHLDASLVAVVIDAAPGEADRALLADKHYRGADRLFAFSGSPQALRYAVNPQWPGGVTPYVAFLGPQSGPAWVAGAPKATDVEAWLAGWTSRR